MEIGSYGNQLFRPALHENDLFTLECIQLMSCFPWQCTVQVKMTGILQGFSVM